VLQPGDQVRVDVKGAWGLDHDILGNAGDRVSVQTFDAITVACDAWGNRTCS
jgi:hypothetical protein